MQSTKRTRQLGPRDCVTSALISRDLNAQILLSDSPLFAAAFPNTDICRRLTERIWLSNDVLGHLYGPLTAEIIHPLDLRAALLRPAGRVRLQLPLPSH